jgi:hypothetical protein
MVRREFARFLAAIATVTAAGCDGGGGAAPVDDVVSFAASATFVVGEDGSVTAPVTLRRSGGGVGAIAVTVLPAGGSATAGAPPLAPPSDFDATPIVVAWADGDLADKTVSVPVLNESLVETDETVALTLSAPSAGAAIGTPAAATLTITNDDFAGTVEFSANAFVYGEDGTATLPVTVRRVGGTAGAVDVLLTTTDGTANGSPSSLVEPVDYAPSATTVSFGDGDAADKVVVIGGVVQDALPEIDETIVLTLSAPTGGAALGATAAATLTIQDDDALLPLAAPTPAANANFGQAVVLIGDRIGVGRPGVPVGGEVRFFDAATGAALGALSSPEPASPLRFGSALAPLGIELAIGAPATTFPRTFLMNPFSGAVHQAFNVGNVGNVFEFGATLDVDGGFLFCGASAFPNGGNVGSGRVWRCNPATGVEETFFQGLESGDLDFGRALLASGGVLYASAGTVQNFGNSDGRIFAYDWNSGALLLQILNPFPTPGGAEHMGASLALFDGSLCAGAPDHDGPAANTGRVYFFDPTTGVHTSTLEPPGATVANGRFGARMAVVRDRLVVQQRGGGPSGAGRLFVFDVSGALVQTIVDPNPTAGADFGAAMSDCDGQLLVGAPLSTVSGLAGAGRAYVVKID